MIDIIRIILVKCKRLNEHASIIPIFSQNLPMLFGNVLLIRIWKKTTTYVHTFHCNQQSLFDINKVSFRRQYRMHGPLRTSTLKKTD